MPKVQNKERIQVPIPVSRVIFVENQLVFQSHCGKIIGLVKMILYWGILGYNTLSLIYTLLDQNQGVKEIIYTKSKMALSFRRQIRHSMTISVVPYRRHGYEKRIRNY